MKTILELWPKTSNLDTERNTGLLADFNVALEAVRAILAPRGITVDWQAVTEKPGQLTVEFTGNTNLIAADLKYCQFVQDRNDKSRLRWSVRDHLLGQRRSMMDLRRRLEKAN